MKLTEIQRQQIIATYIAGAGEISQTVLAQKYGVTRAAISKILKNAGVDKIIEEKKGQNALTILEYIESKQNIAQDLMDKILKTAAGKIENAPLRDLMGALKILAEVFGKTAENKDDTGGSREIVFKIVGNDKNDDADS